MQQLLLILHVLVCVSLVALVLLQHGKGADIGASFGSGASQTIFGSQGPASFLMKVTASLAAIFFATSLLLSYYAAHSIQENQFVLPASQATAKSSLPKESPIMSENASKRNAQADKQEGGT